MIQSSHNIMFIFFGKEFGIFWEANQEEIGNNGDDHCQKPLKNENLQSTKALSGRDLPIARNDTLGCRP